jgi:ankyrin repeat protein
LQALIEGGAKDDIHVWDGMPKKPMFLEPVPVDCRDASGWTPLMCAAAHGHTEMCRLLLESQADVNARKNFSVAPLHLASRGGHAAAVALLLEQRADAMMQKLDEALPIHGAALGAHPSVVELLLAAAGEHAKSAQLKHPDGDGQTCLHAAARGGAPPHPSSPRPSSPRSPSASPQGRRDVSS